MERKDELNGSAGLSLVIHVGPLSEDVMEENMPRRFTDYGIELRLRAARALATLRKKEGNFREEEVIENLIEAVRDLKSELQELRASLPRFGDEDL